MGYPSPTIAAIMALLYYCYLSATIVVKTDAFIPVGPICRQRRLVFSSEIFMSADDNNNNSNNDSIGPPLAFLDARYADLFRRTDGNGVTRPEQQQRARYNLSSFGSRFRAAFSNRHDHHEEKVTEGTNHIHGRRATKSRPVLVLNPETGRYEVSTPTTTSTSAAVRSYQPETGIKVTDSLSTSGSDIVKDEPLDSIDAVVTAASDVLSRGNQQHSSIDKQGNADAIEHIMPIETDRTLRKEEAAQVAEVKIIEESPSSSLVEPLCEDTDTDATTSNKRLSSVNNKDEVLDVVGMAFGSTKDGICATIDILPNTCGSTDTIKNNKKETEQQQPSLSHAVAISSTAADDVPTTKKDTDISDVKTPTETTISTSATEDTTKSTSTKTMSVEEGIVAEAKSPADTASTSTNIVEVSADVNTASVLKTDAGTVPNTLIKAQLTPRPPPPPPTLSEQGVRVVKSAAEAATKIALFVGKTAFTLAVAVAKAALALDDERNKKAAPSIASGIDAELDRHVTDALGMAEDALSSAHDASTKRRKRNFFLGWLGLGNKYKVVLDAAKSPAVTVRPHPPTPPSTLEALQALESSELKQEIEAAIDVSKKQSVKKSSAEEADESGVLKIGVTGPIAPHSHLAEIKAAVKRAKDAAAMASKQAEELEAMLMGMRI